MRTKNLYEAVTALESCNRRLAELERGHLPEKAQARADLLRAEATAAATTTINKALEDMTAAILTGYGAEQGERA